MSSQPHDNAPLTPDTARTALREACDVAGIDWSDAELMRLGENALFHLRRSSLVVRIARGLEHLDDAAKEVAVSSWLAEADLPAAHTATTVAQPVVAAGRPVTFWAYLVGRNGGKSDIRTLGRVLRQLHSLGRPSGFTLPRQKPLGRVLERVEPAPIPLEDKEFLTRRFAELSGRVQDLVYPLAVAPTHGDAHVQNLMIVDGAPVLIDFERFSWGQPEWDLALTATEYLTAGWWTAREYGAFADAYGYDVTDWSGFGTLRAAHEIKMTTWIMQNADHSPEIAREYAVRMGTLRDRSGIGTWRPF